MTAASDVPAGEPSREPAGETPARRRLPFWLRVLVPAGLALAVSLVVGVTTATTELSLGPHGPGRDESTAGLLTRGGDV